MDSKTIDPKQSTPGLNSWQNLFNQIHRPIRRVLFSMWITTLRMAYMYSPKNIIRTEGTVVAVDVDIVLIQNPMTKSRGIF